MADLAGIPGIAVMGVAGSGKTTVGKILAAKLHRRFADADAFHPASNVEKMKAGMPLTDEDREPWLAAIRDWLVQETQAGNHVVLTCSALKRRYRERLRDVCPGLVFVYLKGDPGLIAERITRREAHFMPLALLKSQLETLEEPGPDENIMTVSILPPPEAIVGSIVEQVAELFPCPSQVQ